MTKALEIQNLNVYFGEHHDLFQAVKSASFTVEQGASFGLVGESGSGKSTILKALTGLAPQWEGQLHVAGKALSQKRDKAFYKTVQMVFQDPYASLHPRQCCRMSAWGQLSAFATRTSCPVASGSGWRLRAPWPRNLRSCCWMSRPRRWTCPCRPKS